ncbi:MAG: YfhO family protein [bacterium]
MPQENKIQANYPSTGPELSFRTDSVGILGVTLLVIVLLWPAIGGNRALMSDSWHLNYPWVSEGSLDEEAIKSAIGEKTVSESSGYEPYILEYDIYLENLPWYAFAQNELKAGRWPHWNPYSFCGAPLYANHLVPLTHPPLLLALLFAPLQQVHTVSTFLTWWLAGLGLYFLLRTKRIQPTAAMLAVALYLTSGHFMPLVPYQMCGIMYYPYLWWASEHLEKNPSIKGLIPFALILGLQFAAGHPAYVIPFLYALIIYRILTWVFGRKIKSWWMPRLGFLLLALVFGILISAIQNYPTYKLLELSPRKLAASPERFLRTPPDPNIGMGLGNLLDRKFPREFIYRAIEFLTPVFQRNIERQHLFIGIPLLLLAIIGIPFMRPPPERSALLATLIIFGIIGSPAIFSVVALRIPGFALSPSYPVATIQFLLVLFSAAGAHVLIAQIENIGAKFQIALGILAAVALGLYCLLFIPDSIISPDTRWETENVSLAIGVTIIGSVACLMPWLAPRFRKTPWVAGLAFPLILTVSGIAGHFYQYPVFTPILSMPVTSSIEALPKSSSFRVIRHTSGPLTHVGSLTQPLTFGGNLPMWAGCYDSQGYDSFMLKNISNLLLSLDPDSVRWNGLTLPLSDPAKLASPILDMMAVGYVISDDEDLPGDERIVESGLNLEPVHLGGLDIYRKSDAWPRWFLADEPIPGENTDRFAPSPDRLGEIQLNKETPQILEFKINCTSDCVFILSDSWHPEWHAYVDNNETGIRLANSAFRAVQLTKGDHILIFKYIPYNFRVGLLISALALGLLLIAWFVEKFLTARRGC